MVFQDNDILAIFRLGVESRIINYETIILWADKKINSSHSPIQDFLLDLSLARSKGVNEVVHILKMSETKTNLTVIWQTLYGLNNYLFTKNRIDLKCACYSITFVANEISNLSEYDLFGISLDDAIYLANKGGDDLEEIKKQLLKYTSPYFLIGKQFFEEQLQIEKSHS